MVNRFAHTLLLLLLIVSLSNGQTSTVERRILAGTDALLRAEYDSALTIFRSLTLQSPADPTGPVMEAATLVQRSEDLMIPPDRAAIDSLVTIAELRAEGLTMEDRDQLRMLSFVASGRGILSRIAAMDGDIFRAIREGLSAAALAEDIIEKDSGIVDAALVVGNYYYWKTRKVELFAWLPFVGDSRWEGLRLLERCATAGQFQRVAAMNSLAWALMDAGRTADAERWLRAVLALYPDNRAILRNLATVHLSRKEYREALDTWTRIRSTFPDSGETSFAGRYEAQVHRASLLEKLGRNAESSAALLDAAAMRQRIDDDEGTPRLADVDALFATTDRSVRNGQDGGLGHR